MADLPELLQRYAAFARTCLPRAPLYSRIAAGVAEDPEVAALMLHAPAEQHNPGLLLSVVHDLVLRGDAPSLAAFFPNLAATPEPGDPYPPFRALVLERADEVAAMLAVRRTQTNEVGRCAILLPVLALVAAERGPLAHLDVGASAGLNLLLARYAYRYSPGDVAVGGPSTVELACSLRGAVPLPDELPVIAGSVGLDSAPIDVTDDDAVRWLAACVWPDQADRFARLRAAIALARDDPPHLVRGDAVADLRRAVGALVGGHPVVTTSWVLPYLPVDGQRAFVDELDAIGSGRDLSWVSAEAPAQTPGLPVPTTAEPEQVTVVALTTWRGGRRTLTRLATAHPHGYWLHWEAAIAGASPPPS